MLSFNIIRSKLSFEQIQNVYYNSGKTVCHTVLLGMTMLSVVGQAGFAAPTAILSYVPFITMDFAERLSYFFFFDQGTDHQLLITSDN